MDRRHHRDVLRSPPSSLARSTVAFVVGLTALGMGLAGCAPGDGTSSSQAEAGADGGHAPDVAAEIGRIESGLLPPIPVEGQQGWTLAERMERWNVEGERPRPEQVLGERLEHRARAPVGPIARAPRRSR